MTSSVTLEHSTNSLICNSFKEKFPEFKAPSIIFICNLKYVCRFFAYNKIAFHGRKLKFLETNCGNRTPAYRSRSVKRSYFNASLLCMQSTSCTKSFYHNLDSLGSCRVNLSIEVTRFCFHLVIGICIVIVWNDEGEHVCESKCINLGRQHISKENFATKQQTNKQTKIEY